MEPKATPRWPRLSRLWDDYLAKAGRRKTLGSWQTPEAVARFQARQADQALQRLGYEKGLGDPAVTVIDPCVGTGVYLDAVIREAGCPAQAFNADGPDDKPRMLGADISPTAVAATHIRITATGAEPQLHMTDTLQTSAAGDARPLLDHDEHGLSQVVAAARWDWHEMNRWADRDPGRDPILAIIGNPPYLRAGLEQERYGGTGWRQDVFDSWRTGSGGAAGALTDLYTGFWAWAFNVCRQPHTSLPDSDGSWTLHIKPPDRSLLNGVATVSGIITANDKRWISCVATKSRALKHAYRTLDNRYSPNQPPPRVQRGETAPEGWASGYAEWREANLFDPHEEHILAGGWYAILQALGTKPGPAIHATTHLPDFSLFSGRGGKVVRVGPGVQSPVDYRTWADSHELSGENFWHYALAAAHHPDYWTEGTVCAETLAHHTVEIPLAEDLDAVLDLVDIGKDLVVIWSVDELPAGEFDGQPGAWRFDGHNDLAGTTINGRDVLKKWREARPGDWDRPAAAGYARAIQALTMLLEARDKVGALLD